MQHTHNLYAFGNEAIEDKVRPFYQDPGIGCDISPDRTRFRELLENPDSCFQLVIDAIGGAGIFQGNVDPDFNEITAGAFAVADLWHTIPSATR